MDGSEGAGTTPLDEGLFGPRSMCWKVHAAPSMFVGGLRALLVQTFHPLAMAGVAQHSDYKHRSINRLQRTAYYVAATTFGTTTEAHEAAARVKKIHARVRGIDVVTGQPYSADDPETALWVHAGEVHSFLAAYKQFYGPVTVAEEDQYFRETSQLAPLLGVPREMVPSSKAEMRAYFARVRPRLCVSESSRDGMEFVLHPPFTRDLIPYQVPIRLLSRAAVALLPDYLRAMAGMRASKASDALALAAVAPILAAMKVPGVRDLPAFALGAETVSLSKRAAEQMRTLGVM